MTINKIYHCGFGAVATTLLEIFNLEKKFYNCEFVIIEPREIKTDLFKDRKYKHIKTHITKENVDELLKDINNKTLVIDLTVEVDSLMIIKKTIETMSFYINTSIENWQNYENKKNKTEYKDFKQDTLFYRNQQVEKLLKGTNRTRILNMGFNPGAIQEFAKIGLKKYGEEKGKTLENGNYSKLAYDLKLDAIHIVEYDSQKTDIKAKPDKFVNTWSSVGFQSEVLDYVMLSLNKEDEKTLSKEYKLIKPTGDKKTRIRFIPKKAIDIVKSDYTIDINGKVLKYERGYLVPHAEIITMSEFFNYKGDSPTIMYCYRCADVADKSLEYVRKNNYKPLKKDYVLQNKDIKEGFDSIGASLLFKNDDLRWYGSVLDIETTRKLGFKYGQPTTVQVAGTLYASILYMKKYPNEGYLEPEEVKSQFIMKYAKKYYGKIYYKKLVLIEHK